MRSSGPAFTPLKVHLRGLPCQTQGARRFTDDPRLVTCRLCRSGRSWDDVRGPVVARLDVAHVVDPAVVVRVPPHLPGRPCGRPGPVLDVTMAGADVRLCPECAACRDGRPLRLFVAWAACYGEWARAREEWLVRREQERRAPAERAGRWRARGVGIALVALALLLLVDAARTGSWMWWGAGLSAACWALNRLLGGFRHADPPPAADARAMHELEHAAGLSALATVHGPHGSDVAEHVRGYGDPRGPCLGCAWDAVVAAEREYRDELAT